jgi:hypothetical protein
MPAYEVRFLKSVFDPYGHQHQVPQAAFTIEGPDVDHALAAAQRRFCQVRRIPEWRVHADEFLVEPLRPQRQPRRGAEPPRLGRD